MHGRRVPPVSVPRRTVLRTGVAILGALGAIGCSDATGSDEATDGDSATAEQGSFWSVIAEQAVAADPSLDGDAAATQLGLIPGEVDPATMEPGQQEALRSAIAADVAAGRMRDVAGWDLAETEVLLAVATAGSER